MLKRILPVVSLFLLLGCAEPVKTGPRQTGVVADHAMVVTSHLEATKVGIEILQQGGNAIDAAVAVQFALAVCYPIAGNIGGGGFMVYRDKEANCYSLDFRETAPASAHRDMYLDLSGAVNLDLCRWSHLASGVPGTVDGMAKAHQKFGTLSWGKLIQPAIDLASNGFIVQRNQSENLEKFADELAAANSTFNYLKKNTGWKKGDTLKQPELASTLKLIRDQGRSGFYEGQVAFQIEKQMRENGGATTAADLASYSSKWREPVSGAFQNYRVISMGPPSSGGVLLIQMLNMLKSHQMEKPPWHAVQQIHLYTEIQRRAYADRSEYLGDPDYWPVPVDELLSEKYAALRIKDFNPAKAGKSQVATPGKIHISINEETTHFSIVDEEGNAVAITTTLNSAYGSRIFVHGFGFLLNNEMDDFSAKPGSPNLYGLVGNEANAIAPGKRMLSSMTPTIIEKNGKLFMVLGTPGGSTIITSVFQTFLNATVVVV